MDVEGLKQRCIKLRDELNSIIESISEFIPENEFNFDCNKPLLYKNKFFINATQLLYEYVVKIDRIPPRMEVHKEGKPLSFSVSLTRKDIIVKSRKFKSIKEAKNQASMMMLKQMIGRGELEDSFMFVD